MGSPPGRGSNPIIFLTIFPIISLTIYKLMGLGSISCGIVAYAAASY